MGNTAALAAGGTSTIMANPVSTGAGASWFSSPAVSTGLGMAASAGLGLTGNLMNLGSYWQESQALRQYGDIAYREALLEADRVMEQGRQFKADQKMSYVMSGVQVQGTPLQVLEDTSLKIGDEVNAIKRRGEAQKWLAYAEASQTRLKGVTGFLSGIDRTVSDLQSNYSSAKKAGIFGNTSPSSVLVKSSSNKSNTSTGIYLNKNAFQLSKDYV